MTAQISDTLKYQNQEYEILAIENKFPFKPQDHGFNPVMMHTACYRGYYCLYAIKEEKLLLSELTINQEEKLPIWRGVKPIQKNFTELTYSGLDLPIEYTGRLIIGKGLIEKFYQHMGYQQPHCFEEVLEFKFNSGKLDKLKDKSKKAKKIRTLIQENKPPKKEITKYIRDAFSLSYGEKGI